MGSPGARERHTVSRGRGPSHDRSPRRGRSQGRGRRQGPGRGWCRARCLVLAVVACGPAVLGGCTDEFLGTGTEEPADPATGEGRSAAELLDTLTIAPEANGDSYERDEFGHGWDGLGDGCDVRDQVLADESRVPVTRDDDCDVTAGDWVSLYDNYATPDPEELQIDHMVPLAEAWASGASEWTDEERERYANDLDRPDALVAVTAASNQAKSDRDPAEWMPSNDGAWCRYATAWITQKAAWDLTVDQAEHDALRNILATC